MTVIYRVTAIYRAVIDSFDYIPACDEQGASKKKH